MTSRTDDMLQRVALGSIAIGLSVLSLKVTAWLMTGSVALYSDAMESIVNVASAIGAFVAIKYGSRPPDRRHPYGHTKIEYFSAVLVGVLIVITAVAVAWESYAALWAPKMLDAPLAGLGVNALAGAVNAYWYGQLMKTGRRLGSPALVADGKHLLSDVISSLGVLLGVTLAVVTGWALLDPLLAGLVAVNILISGWRLIQASIGLLMDEAVDDRTMQFIAAAIAKEGDGALQAHDIKTRQAGRATFIEFHLVVPAVMSVGDAHRICDRLEAAIGRVVAGASVIIHVEPPDKAKQHGAIAVS
jgi:cation diffusion facilitator family transporter